MRGPGFLRVSELEGLASLACVSRRVASDVLSQTVQRVLQDSEIDPRLAVVVTSAPIGCDDLFYVPVANDVRGIGYRHQDPREIFDDSPDSRLEGVAFLNDLPYWRQNPEEFVKAFHHEIGHRWSARVHSGDADVLLGREGAHWSYFVDSGGSPLEGNVWTDLGGGRFSADTPLARRRFSELDLYLMGVLPAPAVAPLRVLASESEATDCSSNTVTAASPPQSCGALELSARAERVPLEAIVDTEGVREPAADVSPRSLDVAVIVLDSGGKSFGASACRALTAALEHSFRDFAEATEGRLLLENPIDDRASCDAFDVPAEASSAATGCTVHAARPSAGSSWFWLFLACAARRFRSRSTRST